MCFSRFVTKVPLVECGMVDDIRMVLGELGLGYCAATFVENETGAEVLLDLIGPDLRSKIKLGAQ